MATRVLPTPGLEEGEKGRQEEAGRCRERWPGLQEVTGQEGQERGAGQPHRKQVDILTKFGALVDILGQVWGTGGHPGQVLGTGGHSEGWEALLASQAQEGDLPTRCGDTLLLRHK